MTATERWIFADSDMRARLPAQAIAALQQALVALGAFTGAKLDVKYERRGSASTPGVTFSGSTGAGGVALVIQDSPEVCFDCVLTSSGVPNGRNFYNRLYKAIEEQKPAPAPGPVRPVQSRKPANDKPKAPIERIDYQKLREERKKQTRIERIDSDLSRLSELQQRTALTIEKLVAERATLVPPETKE